METVAVENPYGLAAALEQGGIIAQSVFGILVFMSLASWFIIITKYIDQRKVLSEAKELEKKFWTAPDLKTGAAKLDKNSPFKQIVDDGLRASDHHEGRLTDKIDQHEWVTMALNRSSTTVSSKLQGGLSFLASVGSTSPFIGLFGTVVGIYRALINIGLAGQASIDKVAGPVGEALIMTALGLAVAVPAVLGYNWLIRRNKDVVEKLNNFSADVHGALVSGSRVTAPVVTTPAAAAAVKR
ncbi:MotA/TolQ/ExbB proton channel family protein [Polymorphobacter fuscus]|uniref:Biopolymer transport protein ExbB n=1 Tax=Sandarakinorhabdus fusca TaxID=1439888 RepID=A0A7C9GTM4_9SPHN|nr:MotA/TolQ/ExbB proton channel family protein [Polymorphobacter fuscus]KAB7648653.1 MotA/TolQ/ExbB proton channel family protein [Polymorphobacter fuscus]MQT16209.1 MotA/TolQ/ExbB proton channel family protein [Polymorphobacter fuscus]NJC07506.1 biopolymer transport protein ExbB [Polymorphobacter fuscus]